MHKKVALVTGGSTGIGAAIAKQLAEQGYQVLITGRHQETLENSAAQHPNIHWLVADVSSPEQVRATVAYIQHHYKQLDILVNNAGITLPEPEGQMTLEHVDQLYNVNVRGLVDMTQTALALLKQSQGNIINIASTAGDRPVPGSLIYSSTKAMVIALTKGLAKQLAEFGVRVNAVSPGATKTPLLEKAGLSKAESEAVEGLIPLGRFATVDDIASTVTFLASDKASYITGVQYKVDGGYSA